MTCWFRRISGLLFLSWFWVGCSSAPTPAGKSEVIAPEDMPDICRDINFNTADLGLREECGVTTRKYKAYRNIPVHRNLLLPKNSKIVLTNGQLELRLESFLPVVLPSEFAGQIEFDEKVRRQFLKSKYRYFEYFPPKELRPDKLIQLEIPLADSVWVPVCFIVDKPRAKSTRKLGYARRLLPLGCDEWEKRRLLADSANSAN
jgi:hypothetical protein